MSAPPMPANLRKAEKEAWKVIVAEFGGADALRLSDGPLVRSMAILTARLEDIRAALALAAISPPPAARRYSRRPSDDESKAVNDPLGYLLTATVRGVTGNPLLGHERETIKELRLLHERLERLVAARSADPGRPKSLREMRDSLTAVEGGAKARSS